nr:immunoglobulin light chain junction region [Macaca mulatta]
CSVWDNSLNTRLF